MFRPRKVGRSMVTEVRTQPIEAEQQDLRNIQSTGCLKVSRRVQNNSLCEAATTLMKDDAPDDSDVEVKEGNGDNFVEYTVRHIS